MTAHILDWTRTHTTGMWWMAGLSALAFVATLIIVPVVVVRIPADYFAYASRHPGPWANQHFVLRMLVIAVKNILGGSLIAVGTLMLVLPGQGLLTIAIGSMLLDFPGKYRLERWLVSRGSVLLAINWLRKRAGRVPLEL
ncbi:MAG: hypothetical protein O3B95_13375 [Chloroflexi bacterium]|nr:hypothetical protein [Chloroflexota bacterium]